MWSAATHVHLARVLGRARPSLRAVVGQRAWTRHHAVALTTCTHRPGKAPPARHVAHGGRARGLVVKAAAPEAAPEASPEADFVKPQLRIEVFPDQYEQLLDEKVRAGDTTNSRASALHPQARPSRVQVFHHSTGGRNPGG